MLCYLNNIISWVNVTNSSNSKHVNVNLGLIGTAYSAVGVWLLGLFGYFPGLACGGAVVPRSTKQREKKDQKLQQ